jgi:hypothetical protein
MDECPSRGGSNARLGTRLRSGFAPSPRHSGHNNKDTGENSKGEIERPSSDEGNECRGKRDHTSKEKPEWYEPSIGHISPVDWVVLVCLTP